MVYKVEGKNNDHINRRQTGQFRRFLNEAALKEVDLSGCLYTWSNEKEHPTLERIDRVFISNEWESLFPTHALQALSSLCSNHTSLLLNTSVSTDRHRRFHFLPFWPCCDGFLEVVQAAWHCLIRGATPFQKLDWFFRNTA
jgi:hypothetical protein